MSCIFFAGVLSERYKAIVHVCVGEQRGGGVKAVSKCIWDKDTDNYASHVFINVSNTLYCLSVIVTTSGVRKA